MYDGCYKVNMASLTWIDAGIAAVQQNATLASIHSLLQTRWLTEHLTTRGWQVQWVGWSGDMWLGLHDIPSEADWHHVDGSAIDYAGWGDGEPGGGSAENCAVFGASTLWFDASCSSSRKSLLRWNSSAAQLPQGMD